MAETDPHAYYCHACKVRHSAAEWRDLGAVCARCMQHSGNASQAHYWRLCKWRMNQGWPLAKCFTEFHYCCPNDCELHPEENHRG